MMDVQSRTFLIVGASGGLGAAIAREFARRGAGVLLAARRKESIEALAREIGAKAMYTIDTLDTDVVEAAAEAIRRDFPELDAVINATGFDVRKAFVDHTDDDITRSLNVNLAGAIRLTRAFLPAMLERESGVILHLGGFADGRLAFPYYAADFASRAGLRGFVDSINREIAGSGVTVSYFSPSPADTEAERPFHALWRQMGQRIVSTEEVAADVADAVARRRKVTVMGGWPTHAFAALNTLWPAAADRLLLDGYRARMARYFGVELRAKPVKKPSRPRHLLRIGVVLAILSVLIDGVALAIVPFTALDGVAKVALIPAMVAVGEVTFWAGVALAGSEVISRYRRYLNPCNWALCGRA